MRNSKSFRLAAAAIRKSPIGEPRPPRFASPQLRRAERHSRRAETENRKITKSVASLVAPSPRDVAHKRRRQFVPSPGNWVRSAKIRTAAPTVRKQENRKIAISHAPHDRFTSSPACARPCASAQTCTTISARHPDTLRATPSKSYVYPKLASNRKTLPLHRARLDCNHSSA